MTQTPVHVTFRGIPHSDALEADIQERAGALQRFHPRLAGCRVLVEQPHRHQHSGNPFHVRIEMTVDGARPLVVTHEGGPGTSDPYIATREAFDAARRQLQDAAREQRGDVKSHDAT
jgi:hypothetical protein